MTATDRPAVVDAHVHLWDPARTDWYPYLVGRPELDMGDVTGMSRRFDVPTYLAESAGWNVEKLVNVAAATGRHSVDETLELDRRADVDGHPDAIVGGIPPTESVAEAVALLDRQMAAAPLPGRPPDGRRPTDRSRPTTCSRALQERGLLFELMAHPDQLAGSRPRGLAGVRRPRRRRRAHRLAPVGLRRGAGALGRRASTRSPGSATTCVCKLSGLAMPLGSMSVDAFAPWLEHAIETFGVDRCMFASNFPVDGMHGTFDELYTTFADGHRRPRRRVPRQALRRQRRARLQDRFCVEIGRHGDRFLRRNGWGWAVSRGRGGRTRPCSRGGRGRRW